MNPQKLNGGEFRGALIGMMLGGMSTITKHRYKNSNFRITHSRKQEEYIHFKAKILEQKPLIKTKVYDRITVLEGKEFEQLDLYSNANKYATFLRKHMYKDGVKIVTQRMLNQLTDFGLYLWYLDDGYLNIRYDKQTGKIKEYRVFLYTNGYTLDEVILIQKWFQDKYNISPNINRKGKGFILYFNSSKTRKLMEILKPYSHLVTCMKYKFLDYHNLP